VESAGTWVGVAIAGISLAGTVFANINARKAQKDKLDYERDANRDKLAFDAQLTQLRSELDTAKQGHAECHETQAALKDDLEKCHEQHKQTDIRLTAIEMKLQE
jgi:hypothetical protein